MNRLGCISRYSVAVHGWPAGRKTTIRTRTYTALLRSLRRRSAADSSCQMVTIVPTTALDPMLSKIEWDRRLNDVSQATVTLTLANANPACCTSLSGIEPQMHELTIYRDAQLVWQGPITTTTAEDDAFTIEAEDVAGYLDRIVNTSNVGMKVDQGRDIADLARKAITANLMDPAFTCPVDWACLVPNLHIEPTGLKWHAIRTTLWTAYVLDIVKKLSEIGFEWYATGRRIVIRPERTHTHRPQAVLTADDLTGQVSVVRSADALATRVFATTASDTQAGVTVTEGTSCTPYGRRDLLYQDNESIQVESKEDRAKVVADLRAQRDRELKAIADDPNLSTAQKQNQRDRIRREYETNVDSHDTNVDREKVRLTTEHLHQVARQHLKGRYPIPVSMRVADGATLQPTAPVTIEQLMPGERVDVMFQDRCRRVQQAMRLVRLHVVWDEHGEAVGVSLAPLATTPDPITRSTRV